MFAPRLLRSNIYALFKDVLSLHTGSPLSRMSAAVVAHSDLHLLQQQQQADAGAGGDDGGDDEQHQLQAACRFIRSESEWASIRSQLAHALASSLGGGEEDGSSLHKLVDAFVSRSASVSMLALIARP